jgi:hypothetical protein
LHLEGLGHRGDYTGRDSAPHTETGQIFYLSQPSAAGFYLFSGRPAATQRPAWTGLCSP